LPTMRSSLTTTLWSISAIVNTIDNCQTAS
jgi:hypothetical protein